MLDSNYFCHKNHIGVIWFFGSNKFEDTGLSLFFFKRWIISLVNGGRSGKGGFSVGTGIGGVVESTVVVASGYTNKLWRSQKRIALCFGCPG